MKKKNVVLLILLGLVTLLFGNKVLAADNDAMIGYLKCTYQLNKYGVMWQADSDNKISFAYTDISFKNTDIQKSVFIVQPEYGWHYMARSRAVHNGEAGFAKVVTDNLVNVDSTFQQYLGADGECPKYFYLLKSGSKYVPYFSNETSACGENSSLCAVVGENLPEEGERYLLYNNEKEWVADTSGERACDGAHIRLYLDGRTIKGELSYPNGTNFYSSLKKQSNISIPVAGDTSGLKSMEYIYSLLKNNSINRFFIRGDEGNGKINFNEDGVSWYSCNIAQKTVSPKYNCTTYGEFLNEEVRQTGYSTNAYKIKVREYNNFINNKLCGDNNDCDYSNYTQEQVTDLSDKIKEQLATGEELKALYVKITNYYAENESSVCGEFKDELQQDLKDIQNISNLSIGKEDDPESGTYKLNAVLQALNARADALQDEALQNKIDELITKNKELSQSFVEHYDVLEQKFFANVSLSFKTGCDIITPKLKAWLSRGLDIMKIVALVLALILSMVDFFKGVASGNADTMKKVWANFSRRLIVVAILFLLPIIIEFIFGIINIEGIASGNPLCGIK